MGAVPYLPVVHTKRMVDMSKREVTVPLSSSVSEEGNHQRTVMTVRFLSSPPSSGEEEEGPDTCVGCGKILDDVEIERNGNLCWGCESDSEYE